MTLGARLPPDPTHTQRRPSLSHRGREGQATDRSLSSQHPLSELAALNSATLAVFGDLEADRVHFAKLKGQTTVNRIDAGIVPHDPGMKVKRRSPFIKPSKWEKGKTRPCKHCGGEHLDADCTEVKEEDGNGRCTLAAGLDGCDAPTETTLVTLSLETFLGAPAELATAVGLAQDGRSME